MYTYDKMQGYTYREKEADMWGNSKYEAQERYDGYNTVQVKLKLNCKTDADVIKWINSHKNSGNSSAQGAIKALIRADIACRKPEE